VDGGEMKAKILERKCGSQLEVVSTIKQTSLKKQREEKQKKLDEDRQTIWWSVKRKKGRQH
jgi:hypothetical protein